MDEEHLKTLHLFLKKLDTWLYEITKGDHDPTEQQKDELFKIWETLQTTTHYLETVIWKD